MQQRHLRKSAKTDDDAATSCKSSVNFSAVTSEISFTFYGYWAKLLAYDLHSSRWNYQVR